MQSVDSVFSSGLLNLLALVPGIVVSILGLVLSIASLKRMPRAALAGIVAYGGMLLLGLSGPLVNVLLMGFLARSLPIRGPGLSFVLVQGLASLAFSFCAALASGVLIYGYFFADRKSAEGGKV